MNKSTILSTINGFLTAVITQAKVRSSHSTIVDNLWTAPIENAKITSSLTPLSITTPLNADINYSVTVKRVGNIVYISGYITNAGVSTISSSDILEFTDTDFNGRTSTYNSFIATNTSIYTDNALLGVDGTKLKLYSPLPVGSIYRFNAYYFTND